MQVKRSTSYGRPALHVTNATLVGRNTDYGWFILGYQRLPRNDEFEFTPNMPTGVNIVIEWFSLKPLEFASRVRREINARLDD